MGKYYIKRIENKGYLKKHISTNFNHWVFNVMDACSFKTKKDALKFIEKYNIKNVEVSK